jgi:Tol biopolymer transport system component
MKYLLPFVLLITACSSPKKEAKAPYDATKDTLRFEGEKHLRNIRQLTFGGNNAEAYFSFDNKQLIFQSDWDKINPQGCDQIYVMNVDGNPYPNGDQYQLVSTGKGRTTCSYFHPNGSLIYSSTHEANASCPETVMFAQGRYVWPIYDSYDIYIRESITDEHKLLIGGIGYDAEPTVSPDGKYMIFTSTRSGDLELWRYSFETQEIKQITNTPGYDGGAFFSHDSKQLVWRASRPVGEDLKNYQALLKQGFVEPKALNIFISDIEGNNVKQITNLPGANWAPYFHPDNKKVLFSSNHHTMDQGGRVFDVFMINPETNELTQITHSGTFDAFPMFSHDGKYLVFASNRRADRQPSRDTNVFIAEWID